jgi:hypothetical protein
LKLAGRALPILLLGCSCVLVAQPPDAQQPGMPSSGGYKPPASSLSQLLETDRALGQAMMLLMQGNRQAFRDAVMKAAESGDLGAELMLAEQYIPEQCTFEFNQDVPHCGKNGDEAPKVVFRQNPLGVDASYEEAARWLERASAQGSGEASEVLAQLITRMHANGHATNYSDADSARFHALARSQGFDVEPISVTCYKFTPGEKGISLGRRPSGLPVDEPPREPFTSDELAALSKAGVSGSLLYGGESAGGDSVLLMRPEGPRVNVRIILDHDPGHEVLLPIPAHRDAIYVQRGDSFVGLPAEGPNLPRFVSVMPMGSPASQISFFTQLMDGGHSGGFCARFP